jgi:integrase
LGAIKLTKLAPQQEQVLYAQLLDKGLSPTTEHRIHEMLHRALKDAVELEEVQRNVAAIAKPPRPAHYEMQTLDEAQVRCLVEGVA